MQMKALRMNSNCTQVCSTMILNKFNRFTWGNAFSKAQYVRISVENIKIKNEKYLIYGDEITVLTL